MRYLFFFISIILCSACNSPVYNYDFNLDGEVIQLKLFKDLTFVSHLEKGEENHSYAGYWSGRPANGSFNVFATRDGFDILERELKFGFKVEEGRLIGVTIDTLPAKF
jgi:hypothetical protein